MVCMQEHLRSVLLVIKMNTMVKRAQIVLSATLQRGGGIRR